LTAPELIKVEMPIKTVYDFTKKSNNMRMVNEGKFEDFDYIERCDSKLEEGDLA